MVLSFVHLGLFIVPHVDRLLVVVNSIITSSKELVKCVLFNRSPTIAVTLTDEETGVNLNEFLSDILLSPCVPNVSSDI